MTLPFQKVNANLWQSSVTSALHLLIEMDALEKMSKEGSITSKDLAALGGIDESAIGKHHLLFSLHERDIRSTTK